MSDLISREEAVKKATERHDFYRGATNPSDKARRDELLNVICWLNEMPSAERKGEWIKGDSIVDMFLKPRCSLCGEPALGTHGFDYYLTNFCPNCGADMRGKEDEQ